MKNDYKIHSTKATTVFRKGTVRILCIMVASLFIISGCTKKEKEETQLDLGVYVETYPIEKHTRINFISKEKLVIIKDGSITEFYYVINYKENIIELTMIADPSLGGVMISTLYFRIINTFKFEIENLYPVPAVANAPMVIMTFEKENTQNNEI